MKASDQARIAKWEAQRVALANKINAVREPYDVAHAQSYVGRCFKVRDGIGGKHRWWVYIKVVRAEEGALTCTNFWKTLDGSACIQRGHYYQTITLDRYESISAEEFGAAYAKLLKYLGDLNEALVR